MRSLIAAIRSLFVPATLTDYAYEAGVYNSQRELAEQRGRLSLAKPPHPRPFTGR